MGNSIRVLVIDDSEDDSLLLIRRLKNGGYEPTYERVDRVQETEKALDKGGWDVIICDYVLPRFSAPAALNLLKARGLDIPFIVVSGFMGEETAVEMMKSGAHDYIKKDNMSRLIPAIERERKEALNRRERRLADERLRESNAKLEAAIREARELTENAQIADQAKSQFMAKISHEIRTPLNAITGLTGMLLETNLTEEQRKFVEFIRTSNQSLLTILNDILTFSRIERGFLEQEGHPPIQGKNANPALGIRILVAEDNQLNREVLIQILEKKGHHAEGVKNGQEALEALRSRPFDLVLMDCKMPVMDGYEATKLIRSGGSGVKNPQIPIIALTACVMEGDKELCRKAGMDDYLGKPVTSNKLLEAIDRWLAKVPVTELNSRAKEK